MLMTTLYLTAMFGSMIAVALVLGFFHDYLESKFSRPRPKVQPTYLTPNLQFVESEPQAAKVTVYVVDKDETTFLKAA